MRLTIRPPRLEDFDECWDLGMLSRRMPELKEVARSAWQTLLPARRMQGIVVEDLDSGSIRGVGISTFAHDWFIEQLAEPARPYWAARALTEGLTQNGLLSLPEIRRQNSGEGLNLLVLQHAWLTDDRDEARFLLGDWLTRGYILCHRGFQLKEIWQELFGPIELQYVRAGGGYQIRQDFASYYAAGPGAAIPERERGVVCGVTRSEAMTGNSPISTMFAYSPPLLSLTLGQQDVLLRAIDGQPDRMIARTLGISKEALKKRWQAILNQVRDHAQLSSLIEESELGMRPYLVAYFREHYEELRPHQAFRRTRRASARSNGSPRKLA